MSPAQSVDGNIYIGVNNMSTCDYKGCRKIPVAEVLDFDEHSWSYLCREHYEQEYARRNKLKDNVGWYELTRWEQLQAITDVLWYPIYRLYSYIYYTYIYKSNIDLQLYLKDDDEEC